MGRIPFTCPWHVSPTGYSWWKGIYREGPAVQSLFSNHEIAAIQRDASLLNRRRGTRSYDVFSENALFLEFARLDIDSKEAIQAFADTYGPIEVHPLRIAPDQSAGNFPDWYRFEATPFSCWSDAIFQMQGALMLWELIKKRDLKALGESLVINDHGDGQITVTFDTYSHLTYYHATGQCAKDDLLRAAEMALLIEPTRMLKSHVSPVLVPRTEHSPARMEFKVESLLAGLWIQLSLAYMEGKAFRDCEVCGRPFEIAPDVGRTNKKLCSQACKAKAYRQRKAEAVRLHSQGRTLRQIAKELGSDTPTVKSWLEGRSGNGS